MVILVGREWRWGELSYQVECQDNKMELEQNYSWNIIITIRITIIYLYFLALNFSILQLVQWSVTFCLVFCDIGSGVSVTLMIPTFLEEWNSKQLQMEKMWNRKFKSNFLVGERINRNSLEVEIFPPNIYKDSDWPASAIYLSQLNRLVILLANWIKIDPEEQKIC